MEIYSEDEISDINEINNNINNSINQQSINQISNYERINPFFHSQSLKDFENSIIIINFGIFMVFFLLTFYVNHNSYKISNRENEFEIQNISHQGGNSKMFNSLSNPSILEISNLKNNFHINNELKNFELFSQFKKIKSISETNFPSSISDEGRFKEKNQKNRLLSQKLIQKEEGFKIKESIFNDLFRHSYRGKWYSKTPIFNFESRSGDMRMIMHLATNFRIKDIYLSYILFFYDGNDKTKWMILENKIGISLNGTKIGRNNTLEQLEIRHDDFLAISSEYHTFNIIQRNYMTLNLHYFLNKSFSLNITGKICNFNYGREGTEIEFILSREIFGFFTKVSSLSVFLCLIGIMQTVNSRKLIEKLEANPNQAKHYSQYIFYISNVWNAFVAFGYFYLSLIDERLFNNLIIPTLLYFINFSYLELKLIVLIWKSGLNGRSNEFTMMYMLRNRFTKFYIFFYISIVVSFAFSYEYFLNKYFQYMITGFTFLPQIFHDLRNGTKNNITFGTILVFSVNRLFLPLYFRMCPKNFFEIPVDEEFSYALCFLILTQVGIMMLQKIIKIRFFSRRSLGVNYYNYKKTVNQLKNESIDLDNITCSICLGNFAIEFEEKKENNLNKSDFVGNFAEKIPSEINIIENDIKILRKKTLKEKIFEITKKILKIFKLCIRKKKPEFLLTPCKHLFHIECLRLWMEKKNGCPVCRNELPEYND